MATLNITYDGLSVDYPKSIDHHLNDTDIRRIAVELVRCGDMPGLQIANLSENAFVHFVVDRFHTTQGGQRIYLRPKVPFGGSR